MADDLSVQDLRRVIGLLAKVSGGPSGPAQRREGLVGGLAQLVGASVWFWVQGAGASPTSDPAAFAFQTGGWQTREQQALIVTAFHAPAGMLINSFFRRHFEQHVTCVRSDLATDRVWYASELYRQHHRPAGLDDFLISAHPLPKGLVSAVGFYRTPEAGPFTSRERGLVHLVTAQVRWLHEGFTNSPVAGAVPSLSPRCREILMHLLNGDSRKEIARKLHRSENTIAGAIKTVYRQLGVSSRGELMARFLPGGPPLPLDETRSRRGHRP